MLISSSKGCSPGFIAQPRTSSQQLPCQESLFTLHSRRLAPTSRLACPYVHASRPLPKTPTGELHPERLHNQNHSAATIQSALPQNPLASPVNKSCTSVQWLTRQFQPSRHVDIRVVRLSKAIERVSCALCQRDPQSCTMCLKCAPCYRKRRPTPPHLKWWFLPASCRWACNLRWSTRPWLHGTRVIVPRVLVHGLRNRAISNEHWRPCMCKLRRTVHIGTTLGARFDASYSECRATPTSNGTDCSL